MPALSESQHKVGGAISLARCFPGPVDRLARASDRLLDALVMVLAAWTAIYHVCVVLGLGVLWATVAMIAALWPCVRLLGGEHPGGAVEARVLARPTLRAAAAIVSLGVAARCFSCLPTSRGC